MASSSILYFHHFTSSNTLNIISTMSSIEGAQPSSKIKYANGSIPPNAKWSEFHNSPNNQTILQSDDGIYFREDPWYLSRVR